jgi:dTDP-glucose 4,6-dehydratase
MNRYRRSAIACYLDREDWWRDVTCGAYKAWIDMNFDFRIAV